MARRPDAELDRRTFLRLSGVSATVVALAIAAPEDTAAARPLDGDVFSLGVASGDATDSSVVLWCRLATDPEAADGHGGMSRRRVPVRWEVSEDREFRHIARRGTALASPELAHAVHPEPEGLAPNRRYYYRFHAAGQTSPIGQTRTLPAAAEVPSHFTFATASCQHWANGHYTAYRHLAAEEPDAVLFLGDYIYEGRDHTGDIKRQGATPGEQHDYHCETLGQYRLRYALVHLDPHLQAAHRAAPWFCIWDDHEVQNNWDRSGYPRDDVEEADYRRLQAVAFRAYYENLPLSLTTRPSGPAMPLFRSFDVGGLARFNLTDVRQFRDPVPPDYPVGRDEADRTLLGAEQEAWLYDNLRSSPTLWNVVASGVVLTPFDQAGTTADMWNGFPANRQRLVDAMADSSNPVVISGDIHEHLAGDIRADYTDPDSPTVAAELTTTSVSSLGDGAPLDGGGGWLKNTYVHYNETLRGYVSVRMSPEEVVAEFRTVPYVEADDRAPIETGARFRVSSGTAGLQRL